MTETHQNFKRGAIVFLPPRFPSPGMPRVPPQVGEIVEVRADNGETWKRASVLKLEASRIKVGAEGEEAAQETLMLRKEDEKWRRCDAPLATSHRPPLPQPGEEVLVEVDIEGRTRWLNGMVKAPNTELSEDEFQVCVDGDHGFEETYSSSMEGNEWMRPDSCRHRTLLIEMLKVPTLNTRFQNAVLRPLPPDTPQGFIASLQKGMAVEVKRTDGWRLGYVREVPNAQGYVLVEYDSGASSLETVLCDPSIRLRPAWVWRNGQWERQDHMEAQADAAAELEAEEPRAKRSRGSLEEQIRESGGESSDAGEEAQEEGAEDVEVVDGDEGDNWCIGSRLEALDKVNIWLQAKVVDIRGAGPSRELKVHYDGWNKRYDEWLPLSGGRLRAKQRAEAVQEPSSKRFRAAGMEPEEEVEVEVESMAVSEVGDEEEECSLDLDGAESPDALSNGDEPSGAPRLTLSREELDVGKLQFEICHVDMVGKESGIAQNKLEQLQQLLQRRFCKRNASASFNTSLIKCLTTKVLPPSGSIVMMNYSNGLQLNASSDELAGLHIAMITRPENGSVEDTVVGGACISLIKRSKRSKPNEEGYLALAVTLFAILPQFEKQGAGARLFAEIRSYAVAQKAAQILILSAQPADTESSWWLRSLIRAGLEDAVEPCVNLDNTGTREGMGTRTLLQVLELQEKLPSGLWIPWDLVS